MLQKLFKYCSGRHTSFCVAFFITGNVFHYFHRLDGTYTTFMSALLGLILGHSAQENYFGQNGGQNVGSGSPTIPPTS